MVNLQGDQRISLREKIFREVVANILIHREYTNAFPTSFIIYKDKVESKNANKPHVWGKLKPGNFEPFPKNPHIAQIFTQMGRSEALGTGVQNVFKYNKIYSKTDKNIFREDDIFTTYVPLGEFLGTNEPLNEPLNYRLKQILKHINANNSIAIAELSNFCEVGRETIKRDIKKLKELKIIERIGSDKTGYWKIL